MGLRDEPERAPSAIYSTPARARQDQRDRFGGANYPGAVRRNAAAAEYFSEAEELSCDWLANPFGNRNRTAARACTCDGSCFEQRYLHWREDMMPTTSKAFLLLGTAALLMAQPPQREVNPNNALKSPEVLPDHRVIFRIDAPKASSVEVTGDFVTQGLAPAGKLTKDDKGVWSATVGPLPPDLYTYVFNVDGVRTIDPKNGTVKQASDTMPGGPIDSLVYIQGPGTEFEDIGQGPRGDVREVWYFSKALKVMRRLHVYTPPGYDQSTAKYPVFYLIGGGFDNDSAWNSIGRVNFIMDNLINQGKAKPMIVAMPSESVDVPGAAPAQTRGTTPGGRGNTPESLNQQYDTFGDDLLHSVIPFVEGRYRVLASQPSRAI